MDVLLILRALRRNKLGAILIGLQIALTLAIVCNSLSVIQQFVQRMQQPTGIDEANIFMIQIARISDSTGTRPWRPAASWWARRFPSPSRCSSSRLRGKPGSRAESGRSGARQSSSRNYLLQRISRS